MGIRALSAEVPVPVFMRGRHWHHDAPPVARKPSTPTGLPTLSFPWAAVIAADPTADIAADGLLPGVADFDPISA